MGRHSGDSEPWRDRRNRRTCGHALAHLPRLRGCDWSASPAASRSASRCCDWSASPAASRSASRQPLRFELRFAGSASATPDSEADFRPSLPRIGWFLHQLENPSPCLARMVLWCFLASFSAGSIPVEETTGERCPGVQVRYGRGRKREVKG